MPILPTDHKVDLAEADKQLKQSDMEVEEAVEDILNEESDDEDAVPLVDYTSANGQNAAFSMIQSAKMWKRIGSKF